MVSEAEMLQEFQGGYDFPPLRVRLAKQSAWAHEIGADALLEVISAGQKYEFTAELKSRSSPKVFKEALHQIEQWARQQGRLPMLVVPYLREEQLNELQERQLSGLDLSGNGVVTVPGKLLVYRTGRPNKFPSSAPTKYAYRGATSLVGRVFLCRPKFQSLAEIAEEIEARGGSVALSTVSKALKRLESDLIVERAADRIALRQPDKLLEKLAESYTPPKVTKAVTLSMKMPLEELVESRPRKTPLVLSGRSSVDAYAVMGRRDGPVLFTPNIAPVLRKWGKKVEETSRFVDLELLQTADPTVFFDARPRDGLPYASPVQVFLECAAGDKREQETAEQVMDRILGELNG
ncbi:hypothetical protein [Roseimaritima sediminicola]|uniref:hypothetical protein n=1 Tax=Roseimaritima sediminicola TaxID=2662066 RepID=UPI00129829FA|nr:hypothetical protein [Roseimaritima sediminicola]